MSAPTLGKGPLRVSERLATKRAIEESLTEVGSGSTNAQQNNNALCPAGVADVPSSMESMKSAGEATVSKRSRISESIDTATNGCISCVIIVAKCLAYPFISLGSGLLKMVFAMLPNKKPALENSITLPDQTVVGESEQEGSKVDGIQASQPVVSESKKVTIDTVKDDLYAAALREMESSDVDRSQLNFVREILDGFFKALCDKYPDDLQTVCAKFRKAIPELVTETGVFGDILVASLNSMSRAERSRRRKAPNSKRMVKVNNQEAKLKKVIRNLIARAEKGIKVKRERAST